MLRVKSECAPIDKFISCYIGTRAIKNRARASAIPYFLFLFSPSTNIFFEFRAGTDKVTTAPAVDAAVVVVTCPS